MSEIHVLENEQAAAQAAAIHIVKALAARLEGADRARIAVSGGSTPRLMFAEMATRKTELDWKRVDLFWVDRRRLGHALDCRFSRLDELGRPQRIRRLFHEYGHGAGRNSLQ